jgi:uncharacterized OB-fold protein
MGKYDAIKYKLQRALGLCVKCGRVARPLRCMCVWCARRRSAQYHARAHQ